MSPDGRTAALAAAIQGPNVSGLTAHAARHVRIARSGDKLAIARLVYEDRAVFAPFNVPERFEGADRAVINDWLDGAVVPDGQKESIAAWLEAQTRRRRAIAELETRLRGTLSAWRVLAQSELPDDKRIADAFRRWHFERWQIVDLPIAAPAGHEQPFEDAIKTAVQLRAGR